MPPGWSTSGTGFFRKAGERVNKIVKRLIITFVILALVIAAAVVGLLVLRRNNLKLVKVVRYT